MAAELALTIVYEEGEDGWLIATIPEISGVFSQGKTREEARANVIDALQLMLSPEPPHARKICAQLEIAAPSGAR